jgi:hypothetical protein
MYLRKTTERNKESRGKRERNKQALPTGSGQTIRRGNQEQRNKGGTKHYEKAGGKESRQILYSKQS